MKLYNETERKKICELGLATTLQKLDKIVAEMDKDKPDWKKHNNQLAIQVQQGYIDRVRNAVKFKEENKDKIKWKHLISKWIDYHINKGDKCKYWTRTWTSDDGKEYSEIVKDSDYKIKKGLEKGSWKTCVGNGGWPCKNCEDKKQECINMLFALTKRIDALKQLGDWLDRAERENSNLDLEKKFEDKEAWWYDTADWMLHHYEDEVILPYTYRTTDPEKVKKEVQVRKVVSFKELLTQEWIENYITKTVGFFVLWRNYHDAETDVKARKQRIEVIADKLSIDLPI